MNQDEAIDVYLKAVEYEDLEKRLAPYRVCNNPTIGMAGPYVLNRETVSSVIGSWKNGWYWLGRKFNGGVPQMNYVGRSDSDLAGRILTPRKYEYKWFWFQKTRSEKKAFEGECRDWHTFTEQYGMKLDNDIHPDEPDDKLYPCPIAGCDLKRGRKVKGAIQ